MNTKRKPDIFIDCFCFLMVIGASLSYNKAFTSLTFWLGWCLGLVLAFWVMRALLFGVRALFKNAVPFDWVFVALGAALLLWWAIAAL